MPTLTRISSALRVALRSALGRAGAREAAQILDGAKGFDPDETVDLTTTQSLYVTAGLGAGVTSISASRKHVFGGTLTAGSGTARYLQIRPEAITLNADSGAVYAVEVNPTAMAIGGGTPATATSLYVASAPTGGTTNYALWVDSGDVRLDGDLIFNGTTGVNQIVLVDDLAAALGVQISGGATLMNFKTSSEVVQVKRLSIPETADAAGTCLSMEPNLNPGPSGDAATIFLTSGSITTQNNGESVFAVMLDDGQAAVVEHTTINICGIFLSAMTADASTSKTTTNAATLYIQGAPILTNITATNGPYSLFVAGGDSRFSGRVLGLLETVASGTTITLQSNAAVFTGTTTINHITTTNWIAGSSVTLLFETSLTVTHNAGSPPANTAPILLAGAANFSATANDSLTLMWNGTNWRETARTVI